MMNTEHYRLIFLSAACALVSACSTPVGKQHVVEVTTSLHTQAVTPQDEELFMVDRASRINFTKRPLLSTEQFEEFYVRWVGDEIHSVKFEYRQIKRPDQVLSQTQAAQDRPTCNFRVPNAEFLAGGSVSAWRVTLWSKTGSCLGEKHSALW